MRTKISDLVEAHLPCEDCGSSDALSKYTDHSYCFSCKVRRGSPNGEAKPDQGKYTYEYLPWRGITKETMQFYGVKTKIDSSGKPISLGYRWPSDWYTIRDLDKKRFHTQGTVKPGLFGRNLFDPGSYKSVIITEGAADALACWQVLKVPAVSVRSSSSARSDCTGDHSWLQSFDTIYLALDGDTPGKDATNDVARLFQRAKVKHVRFNRRKDALSYLENGEQSELWGLWQNSKNYLPETIISSLSDFSSILEKTPEPGIPYPFPKLNEATYGIRTGESVLVTAQEGVGKTEFLHALEYSILRGTAGSSDRVEEPGYNVGAIFLEETSRRHLEALAGIHLRAPCHLPDSGCTQDQIASAIREILQKDDRLFLDTRFGSCDVRGLLDNIRFLVSGCGCRVIMLDHISVAVGGSEGEDERKQLDLFFTEAEMMVKELDFALIIVSHVNDFGQTRGSRWGGKMADIRIDLSRELGSNIMNITLSKNRFGGKTGFIGSYSFDPLTRVYEEVANDNQINSEVNKTSEERSAA